METIEEQTPASRPSPGEGAPLRLFDGMGEVLACARRNGIEMLVTPA